MEKTHHYFAEFVKNYPPPQKPLNPLPLMRTVTARNFRDIIHQDELSPIKCDIFENENLLYLFYGRPAYKPNRVKNANSFYCTDPVCFVFRPESVKMAKRIFPFDSGGFLAGLYKNFIDSDSQINDFIINLHVNPINDSIKVVSIFFRNNKNYFMGNAKASIEYGAFEHEVQEYHNLIRALGESNFDDRRGTIEIQIAESLPLSKDTMLAVVLPERFLNNSEVIDIITNKWGAEVLTYIPVHASPEMKAGFIIKEVHTFLKEKNLI